MVDLFSCRNWSLVKTTTNEQTNRQDEGVSNPSNFIRNSNQNGVLYQFSTITMMVIAFITLNSGLVPLIEVLCAQILDFRFEIIGALCSHLLLFSFEIKNV